MNSVTYKLVLNEYKNKMDHVSRQKGSGLVSYEFHEWCIKKHQLRLYNKEACRCPSHKVKLEL